MGVGRFSEQELEMTESKRKLHEVLGEFHEVLERSHDLDTSQKTELEVALGEIRDVLEAEGAASYPETIVARLREAIEGFEDRHPRLTEIVGRVADQLSDLGI
jgi:hypothetical protein